jgi:hypothetical protein
MRDLTVAERAEVQRMTDAVAKTFKARKAEQADGASALTFSGQVNFSDTRNDTKADFNFDDFNKQAKAETALFTIKRLVARSGSGVADSIKKYLLQRNSVIAANKAKAKEKELQKKDKFVSHPNFF